MDESLKQNPEKKSPLAYEETPIIDPASGEIAAAQASTPTIAQDDAASVVPEAARVFQTPKSGAENDDPLSEGTQVTEEYKKKTPKKVHVGTILFIVILFGLGVWLSSQLRTFFAPSVLEETIIPTRAPLAGVGTLVETGEGSPSGTLPRTPRQVYNVISGVTKKPIDGLTYQLPSEIKEPVCDSQSCASQGTNLPGGTRFTVAARGKGQLLPDFRGAILTDAAGREFVMKQTMVGAQYVYEYVGDFTGRTGGGYAFTKMRGVLVPVSETLGIEFNHFAPAGITSDFANDDVVFNDIIASFKGAAVSMPTPTVSLPAARPTTTSANF